MAVALPRSTRIAGPGYHRSVGLDVLALGVAGFLSPLIPRIGGAGMLVCFAAAFIAGARRPTMGAYEGEDGLVVRNYFRTRLIPWRNTVKVSSVGDMALPFVHVGAVELVSGLRMRVTALRYVGEPSQEVLILTRVVRERREARLREPWRDD